MIVVTTKDKDHAMNLWEGVILLTWSFLYWMVSYLGMFYLMNCNVVSLCRISFIGCHPSLLNVCVEEF